MFFANITRPDVSRSIRCTTRGFLLPARPQMRPHIVERRSGVAALRERNREQPGRLVDDDQLIVLVDDFELAVCDRLATTMCAARPVDPDAHDIARRAPSSRHRPPSPRSR